MKDFNSRYGSSGGMRQKVSKRGSVRSGERTLLWRATGAVAILALVAGVTVSLWFGYRIDATLDELALRQERLQQSHQRNVELQRQQDELLTEERVQAAAGQRGLFPPAAEQIRKM